MQLDIRNFILNNSNWESKITDTPYNIKVKRDNGYVLLKYDQIRSDMSFNIVRECRGIIFDEVDGFHPVCVPFFKFGNYGESYVPDIDWSSARVQEKLDGSLMKLWHHNGKWHISSNGEIDARNAHISSALIKNARKTDLYSLFIEAFTDTDKSFTEFDENYTYMFELTSPHNRVVVRYNSTSLRHIGTRNIHTLQECDIDLGIAKPREFSFKTIEDCIENAKQLGYDDEGYVVVDRFFNRVKIKSPLYVALNHISQGVTTNGNIVEIIQRNEQHEFLTYFPEFQEVFNNITTGIDNFSKKQTATLREINTLKLETRKALAEVVTKTDCPSCIFALIDKKEPNAHSWLLSRPSAKILDLIQIYD